MLVKAFITPIEREDIMQVSQNLDDLTDKIEDVLIKIYYNGISGMRADSLKLAEVIIQCCDEVRKLMNEFADFKKSKKLHEHIVRINSLEEEADKLFIDCMYDLHNTCKDPLEVIAWREIYIYLEKCADACEHVADTVESTVMKTADDTVFQYDPKTEQMERPSKRRVRRGFEAFCNVFYDADLRFSENGPAEPTAVTGRARAGSGLSASAARAWRPSGPARPAGRRGEARR